MYALIHFRGGYRNMPSDKKSRLAIACTFLIRFEQPIYRAASQLCNISNPTMRTGLDFKSAQFDPVRGEAEDWIKLQGLEI